MIVLAVILIYAAFQHYKGIEINVYKQSQANLRTATTLIQSQLKNSINSFSVLNQTWQDQGSEAADSIAFSLIKNTENYADILKYNPYSNSYFSTKQSYFASLNEQVKQSYTLPNLSWTALSFMSGQYQISNIYQNSESRWVFALRQTTPPIAQEYILEYDLPFMTQYFIDLKTLENGYLFVIDAKTGQFLMHPEPTRIGKPAVFYSEGIRDQLNNDKPFGQFNYYDSNRFKIGSYSAQNSLNWVFVATTSRSELIANAYANIIMALISITLILIVSIFHYLNSQMQHELEILGREKTLLGFNKQVKHLFSRFCSNRRTQFCLYDSDSFTFYTIDFHGSKQPITVDAEYAEGIDYTEPAFNRSNKNDRLAQQMQLNNHYYRVPLIGQGNLIGVLFIESKLPTYTSLIKLLKTYVESTLNNLLLHEKLYLRDTVTNQDNLFSLRKKITICRGREDVYLLTADVDDLKLLNYQHGYLCGDQVILAMSETINNFFPGNSSLSIARHGDDEFCVLYQASHHNHAFALADELRIAIENAEFVFEGASIKFTASIGVSQIRSSTDQTLINSHQAMEKSKLKGKNHTVMNVL
jgi:diguanylate cyclase (GGDEF)-like protein